MLLPSHFMAICHIFLSNSCDWPSNLTQIGLKSSINQPMWPWNLMKNNKAPLLYYIKLCASFQIQFKLELQSGNTQFGSKLDENWRMTLKNNRAPFLYYIKLCASFQIHWWSQTWVAASKHSSRVKIGDFLSRVTLKIDVWPWKTIGHLSYAASNFVHHFIANGEFKLELCPIWAKIDAFLAMWPWTLMDDLEEQ